MITNTVSVSHKDPAFLPKVEALVRDITVTDPNPPHDSWSFTFSVQPGLPEHLLLQDTIDELNERYVVGRMTVPVNGVNIRISRKLAGYIALLLTHDRTVYQGMPPWSFTHWVSFSLNCPTAFTELLTFLADLQNEAAGGTPEEVEARAIQDGEDGPDLGNGSGAGAVPS